MKWSENQIRQLIKTRLKAEEKINDEKLSTDNSKINIWDVTLESFDIPAGCTRRDVRKKYAYLVKTYKKHARSLINENKEVKWPYFDIFHDIYKNNGEFLSSLLQEETDETIIDSNKRFTDENTVKKIKSGEKTDAKKKATKKSQENQFLNKSSVDVTRPMVSVARKSAINASVFNSKPKLPTKQKPESKANPKQKADTKQKAPPKKKEQQNNSQTSILEYANKSNDFKVLVGHLGQTLDVIDEVSKKFMVSENLSSKIDGLNENIKKLVTSLNKTNKLLESKK